MPNVHIAEAGELDDSALQAAEALVRSAFGAKFRTHDWLHAVDGVHVVVTDGDALVAHAAVVPRILRHHGDHLNTGYVEAVAVAPDLQGQGHGRVVMEHAESVIRTRHQLGALNAVREASNFYAARGWELWDGPTQADTPTGVVDIHDPADRIFLLPSRAITLDARQPLICDWRAGDLW